MNVLDQQDTDLDTYEQKLVALQEKLNGLATITADNFEEAAIHIGACKAAERWIESERDKKVRPLNEEVKEINGRYKGCAMKWESVRTRLERGCSLYRMEQKRIADERQRLELEAARQEQAEKEEKLRIERETLAKKEDEARLAQEQADMQETDLDLKIERAERQLRDMEDSAPENMSATFQRQLLAKQNKVFALRAEKAALAPVVVDTSEADAKREAIARLESEVAMPVVAQVVEQIAKTIKSEAGSVTLKDDKKVWQLTGWDQKVKKCSLDVVDPVVLKTLPREIQWLLKVSILDVPALNASYKNKEPFPHPFGEVGVFGGSNVRYGKA